MPVTFFLFPAIYSAIVMLATCVAFYGGYTQYMNTVSIIGWLLIVPFCVLAILYAKKKRYQGHIGGRNAVKEGLAFILFSTILLVIFQSVFFTLDFKAYKINFMQTYGFALAKAQIANGHLKITEAEIPGLIRQEVAQVTLFKECTGLVFKNFFLGTMTSIVCGVIVKTKAQV